MRESAQAATPIGSGQTISPRSAYTKSTGRTRARSGSGPAPAVPGGSPVSAATTREHTDCRAALPMPSS
ncbi:hypothetical protein ACLQ2H_28340 [Streptomyces globisporus]|uniref:hypothetical protein n=1 Tax=Streptomyces globisporus TaxID=1908 RepID=UPI003CECF85D